MILISNDFWHHIKKYNFEPYNVLLSKYSCAVMTASVLQRHVYIATSSDYQGSSAFKHLSTYEKRH